MITVAGLSPSLDLTYLVDSLELGQIHRPSEVVRCAGGKPLNLARAAAALGAEVQVVAVLGGTTGTFCADQLLAAGIGVAVVSTPAETRTCVSIAAADRSDLTELYPAASPITEDVWAEFATVVADRLALQPGWLAISGGPPRGMSPEQLAQLVDLGHSAGAQVAVDTHGPALPLIMTRRPELVKINRYEAAELLGVEADGDLLEMAAAIRELTGGRVVLTDAVAGSVALDETGGVRIGTVSRVGAYPVGSGDSFLGGLLSGLDAGLPLRTALATASAAGTANALVPGPALFSLDTVAELRDELLAAR